MNRSFLKNVGNQAGARVRQALGPRPDPELKLYESLKPADFDHIAMNYGQDGLAQYVAAMEAKRAQGGKRG